MASTASAAEGQEVKASTTGVSMIAMLGVTLLAMTVVVGGTLFWLTRSGRLPVGAPAKVDVVSKIEPPKMRLIALEPLLVNLADTGGAAYLRVAIVLRVDDPPAPKDTKPKAEDKAEKGKQVVSETEVLLRDTALDVIGRENGDSLALPSGKEHLKVKLRAAFSARVAEVKVDDVLFTEFLIQR